MWHTFAVVFISKNSHLKEQQQKSGRIFFLQKENRTKISSNIWGNFLKCLTTSNQRTRNVIHKQNENWRILFARLIDRCCRFIQHWIRFVNCHRVVGKCSFRNVAIHRLRDCCLRIHQFSKPREECVEYFDKQRKWIFHKRSSRFGKNICRKWWNEKLSFVSQLKIHELEKVTSWFIIFIKLFYRYGFRKLLLFQIWAEDLWAENGDGLANYKKNSTDWSSAWHLQIW